MSTIDIHPASSPPYKDRRGLLIAFGVVQMLIGAFLLLMAGIMLLVPVPEVAGTQPQAISKAALVGIGLIIYGLPAIVFIALGIGSTKAKNWARVGTLVVSWLWLVFGVLQILIIFFLMPSIIRALPHQPNQPANFEQTLVTVSAIFFALFFVLLPAIFLVFYHSRNVRETCLAGRVSNPVTQKPGLIVGLVVWMSLGLLGMLYVLFTQYPAAVFGVLLPGIWGKAVYLLTGIVYTWAIWGLWRLKLAAWRATLWLQLFWIASGVVTFATRDTIQLYREMGMSETDLAFFQRLPISANHFVLLCLLPAVLFMALLFYAKRYFNPNSQT